MAVGEPKDIGENKMPKNERFYLIFVIGSPGAGKSTFCQAACQFYAELGRCAKLVNLDPGNHRIVDESKIKPYADILDLVSVTNLMRTRKIGPNNALIEAMGVFAQNFDWFIDKIVQAGVDNFIVCDLPGQTELYSHENFFPRLIEHLRARLKNLSVMCVNFIDALHCSDAYKYISGLLLSLTTMANLELPQINVLSKIDILPEKMKVVGGTGGREFDLEFYTDVLDLKRLLDVTPDSKFSQKYKKFAYQLADVVERYNLVNFVPLHVESKHLMAKLIFECDKTLGYYGQKK